MNFLHSLQDVTITDLGSLHIDSILTPHDKEAEIAHNRDNDRILGQSALLLQVVSTDCHHNVTVDQRSVLIYRKHTIRITVKSDTYVRFLRYDTGTQLIHMCRSTVGIDIRSIRRGMYCDQFCAEIL